MSTLADAFAQTRRELAYALEASAFYRGTLEIIAARRNPNPAALAGDALATPPTLAESEAAAERRARDGIAFRDCRPLWDGGRGV